MRRLLKWIAITLGVTALVRWLRRRKADSAVATETEPPDPADELRQRLAESREAEAGETAPEAPQGTVEERRAEVHEQARAALDEMTSSNED